MRLALIPATAFIKNPSCTAHEHTLLERIEEKVN